MVHILPCNALQRHRSCDTYTRISPYWSFLWAWFYVILGLELDAFTRYTGAVCAIEGWVTGAIPAFLLLTGRWDDINDPLAIGLAVFAVVVFGLLYPALVKKGPDRRGTTAEGADQGVVASE